MDALTKLVDALTRIESQGQVNRDMLVAFSTGNLNIVAIGFVL